jgi:integrase
MSASNGNETVGENGIFKRRKKGESKTVPLNAEAQRSIEEQLRRFREKFGRGAGPEDPLFFDPDADTPQPITEAQRDEIMSRILRAASRAGIRPELIYAMKKTDRMVTEANKHLLTDEELQVWQDAIDEYLTLVKRQQGREQ